MPCTASLVANAVCAAGMLAAQERAPQQPTAAATETAHWFADLGDAQRSWLASRRIAARGGELGAGDDRQLAERARASLRAIRREETK